MYRPLAALVACVLTNFSLSASLGSEVVDDLREAKNAVAETDQVVLYK